MSIDTLYKDMLRDAQDRNWELRCERALCISSLRIAAYALRTGGQPFTAEAITSLIRKMETADCERLGRLDEQVREARETAGLAADSNSNTSPDSSPQPEVGAEKSFGFAGDFPSLLRRQAE